MKSKATLRKPLVVFLASFMAVCFAGSPQLGKEFPYDAYNPQQSLFRWVDSSRALLLQRLSNKVYFTKDGGMNWADLANALPGSTETGSEPGFLYPNDVDPSKVYIRGNKLKCWRSNNGGDSWESFTPDPPLLYRNLLWHPYRPDWAIAGVETDHTATDGTIDLYITQNFGTSWQLVLANVTRPAYSWGDAGRGSVPVSRIYVARRDVNDQYLDFQQTDDWGAKLVVLQSKTRGFVFLDKQLFVAVYLPDTGETVLKVSPDIGYKFKRFYQAEFPFGKSLVYNGYTILDDSTGAVFLGVNHGDSFAHWGNLYLSDASGSSFVTSLLHVNQIFGVYDFTRVRGLDGIYLSNAVVDWEDKETTDYTNSLQSYVTFNNGGDWRFLARPLYDSNDQPIDCAGTCHLHLHGFTSSISEQSENYGPFYSSVNTVGLLVANGNVGPVLSHDRSDVATYISTDAGIRWNEIRKGPSIYEFGDQGGILVLAPTGEPTSNIYYSLNQGKSLLSFEISRTAIHVNNIITDPTGNGKKFIVLAEKNGAGMIVGVDFTSIFDRTCDRLADYDDWTPKDGRTNVNGLNCLLGRDVTYRRRKQESLCGNIPNLAKPVSVKNCSCTDDDWECDYGFERATDGVSCVKLFDPEYPPHNCEPGATYYITTGYRKVAGNTCEGGVQHVGDGPFDCPKDKVDVRGNKGWIAAVVILPIVFILLVAAFLAMRSEKLREKIPVLKVLHDWRVGYFNPNNTPNRDILMEDDDQLSFNNMDEDADAEHFVNQTGSKHDVDLLHKQPDIEQPSHHEDPFDPRK